MDFSGFYTDTTDFQAYSLEHLLGVLVVLLFGIWFLYKGKYHWSDKNKWRYALIFAVIIYGIQLFKTFFRMYLGNIDYTEDLPLHLCNILPLFMIIGLYFKSRLVFSIVFYWIIAGTAQANITPTLEDVFPHYESIRYWAIHTGLPILAIYTFCVLGYRYTFKDVVRSALTLNLLAAIIYPINLVIGSNYLYLNAKPPPGTLYDVLGPWPWYILSLEIVMLILFSIVHLPFLLYERRGETVCQNS